MGMMVFSKRRVEKLFPISLLKSLPLHLESAQFCKIFDRCPLAPCSSCLSTDTFCESKIVMFSKAE